MFEITIQKKKKLQSKFYQVLAFQGEITQMAWIPFSNFKAKYMNFI